MYYLNSKIGIDFFSNTKFEHNLNEFKTKTNLN
jgi:hypothetical protein